MTDRLIEGLNPQQAQAVTAPPTATLVLAGPGSGKTRVLTRRIAYYVEALGMRPWHIMAVTFTNKAAAEMRHRVRTLLEETRQEPVTGLQIGTFHATCARILRAEYDQTPYKADFTIYDTADQVRAMEDVLGTMNIDKKRHSPRAILHAISAAKNELIAPAHYPAGDYFGEIVARVYPPYQAFLVKNNAMDFDDLLMQMVIAMQTSDTLRHKYQQRYEAILVDEFQDTNTAQYQLVKLFGAPQNNVFVVGDEDQSIYAFRGADYRNVERFREDYAGANVILLEQNYRSTQVVLDAARAIIDHNKHRTPKALFTEREGGIPIHLEEAFDDNTEARYVVEQIQRLHRQGYRYADCAVMYRTNPQSRAFEAALRNATVPYQLVGGKGFYERREVRDMLAYLRVVNSYDRMSFLRVVNVPKRGIGDKSVDQLMAWVDSNSLTLGEAMARVRHGDSAMLATRVLNPLRMLTEQVERWQAIADSGHLLHLFDTIRADIGYTLHLTQTSETPQELIEREDNLKELRGLLHQAEESQMTLSDFLAEQALMTDIDTQRDDQDTVTLLTLHAAKGLEYPIVFIVGLEDGLLPHMRSLEEPDGIQEERRLLYVGITRAQDRLFLTYAFRRALYGGFAEGRERSAFLRDLPMEVLDAESVSRLRQKGNSSGYQQATTWGQAQTTVPRGESLLNRDLRAKKEEQPYTPNERISSKIIPFPNGAVSKMRYKPNQRVTHPVFGAGHVIKSGLQGGEEVVTVVFSNKKYGIKELSASYANLTVLE